MGRRPLLSFVLGALFVGPACSLWNRVDVCKQEAPAPILLNHRLEGIQKTSTPGSMVALPDGNALVVFASQVADRPSDEAMEIHSMRLTGAGARLSRCEINDQVDDVMVPVDLTNKQLQWHESAYAAGPIGAGRTGLVTFLTDEGERPHELWGLFFKGDGCPFPTDSERRKPFLIASALPGEDLAGNATVAIGGDSEDDFLVLWEELSTTNVFGVKARVVRGTPSGPVFLPTRPAPDGGVALLSNVPGILFSLAPAPLGGGRVAIAAHYSTDQVAAADSNVLVWFVDDRLQIVAPTAQVALGDARGEQLPGRSVSAAFDGRTLLLAWAQNDAAGRVSIFTRALDPLGRPRGRARRLSTADGVTEGYPMLMAWPQHGFLAAWRQQNGQGDAAASVILGRRLDASGDPVFTGIACGEEPFVIAQQPDGDRRQPTLAPLASHDVLAVWTDDSKSSPDTSGSSVQGRIINVAHLFVGDEKPGGRPGKAPADASAVATDDGGVDPDAAGACSSAPGQIPGGAPCTCTADCASGGFCVTESASGEAGGVCYQTCDKTYPDACGPAGICHGTPPNTLCSPACQTTAECGPFRICARGACVPFCAADSDCRSGHCDPYRHVCSRDGQTLSGKGLNQECLRDDDCRSRVCPSASHRCRTSCAPERPDCPDSGVCIAAAEEEFGGLCQNRCTLAGTCSDPKQSCSLDPVTGKRACW